MIAWRVRRPGPMRSHPLERVTADIPRPADDELLVAVRACGVCRTDLHVSEGDLPVHRPGVTPGHEVVGEVLEIGSAVEPQTGLSFSVGDPVGIAWLRHTCGVCRYCVRGDENLCPESRYTGWDADGGYAEFATVPAAFAHRLPTVYSDAEWRHCCARASSATGRCCARMCRRADGWGCTGSVAARTSPPRWRSQRESKCM